jgi:hypothetical protein
MNQPFLQTNHGHISISAARTNTGASVTLITPQTFEHARRNGKVGKKWTGHGISIKNASGGEMEITGVYVSGNIVIPAFS